MSPEESRAGKKMISLSAFFEIISLYAELMVRQSGFMLSRFFENFEVEEMFEAACQKLAEHKILRFIVYSCGIICSIPMLMFIWFGLTSLFITMFGFLFVEGTLLALSGIFMFLCTGLIICMVVVFVGLSFLLHFMTSRLPYVIERPGPPLPKLKKILAAINTVC